MYFLLSVNSVIKFCQSFNNLFRKYCAHKAALLSVVRVRRVNDFSYTRSYILHFQVKREPCSMNAEAPVTSPQDKARSRWSVSSSSGLHYGSFANSLASLTPLTVEKPAISPRRAHIAIAVLCYLNLLNYMERYTIAGWMILSLHMTTAAVNKHSTAA